MFIFLIPNFVQNDSRKQKLPGFIIMLPRLINAVTLSPVLSSFLVPAQSIHHFSLYPPLSTYVSSNWLFSHLLHSTSYWMAARLSFSALCVLLRLWTHSPSWSVTFAEIYHDKVCQNTKHTWKRERLWRRQTGRILKADSHEARDSAKELTCFFIIKLLTSSSTYISY